MQRLGGADAPTLSLLADLYTNQGLGDVAAETYVASVRAGAELEAGRGALRGAKQLMRLGQLEAAKTILEGIETEASDRLSQEATAEQRATRRRLLADAGAAGASIEDWSGDSAMGFYPTELAVDRVQAAIAAARSLPTPFVVNARAESYLYGAPNPYDHAIERLQRFAALGADCVYAPGPSDEATLARLVTEAGAPLNALFAVGGSLTMADAVRLGIRRVSVGGSLFRAMMGYFEATVARMVATGELDPAGPMVADERFDDLFG